MDILKKINSLEILIPIINETKYNRQTVKTANRIQQANSNCHWIWCFSMVFNSGSWNTYDKPPVNGTTADLHLTWNIPYEPGTLKAVGKRNGEIVYTTTVATAGAPAALRVSADKKSINSNGEDIVHIKVEIVDVNDTVVPDANNEIQFEVKGEGKLIGVENGNQRDLTSPTSKIKKAFNGLVLGYVQSTQKQGNIDIKVSSNGLKDAEITIEDLKNNIVKL